MSKIEIIKIEVEIVKSKLFTFLTIASGSWIYALKIDDMSFKMVLFICFSITSYGVFINMLKLSDLHNELKGLK